MLINSHSYLPLSKLTKERWAKDETDLFYQILRSYGADFTFMAQCFSGRTRKQVCCIASHLNETVRNPILLLFGNQDMSAVLWAL